MDSEAQADKINPNYYEACNTDCFSVMREVFSDHTVYEHCILTAFEYLWRSKNKNQHEDILKANKFLEKAIEIYDEVHLR